MTISSKWTRAGLLSLGLTTLAWAAGTYSLIVNGQVISKNAVVINGETYVPLSALKLLGVTGTLKGNTVTLALGSALPPARNASGGANQMAALEGCLNQTLFNGIWRAKVLSLTPIQTPDAGSSDVPGWAVKLEIRNGIPKTASLMGTGFGASSGGSQPMLLLADGTSLTLNDNDFLKPWSQDVLQGGVLTFALRFSYPRGTTEGQARAQRPTKFILQINPRIPEYMGMKYSVPDPSLRVRLDC
ncbi:hypothetical protein E7T06_13985 [Deinococcus sp. Arct2-2]|uniref:hypothetical protein n=1 Tax=Deinococcus sp. Arct2-2 TaxID=2568653 RepID=UPI0010A435FE|nr:hypothetical protein [Deinococcus sp. Arct2-2]THF68975.1 hypothetical protein E7T06_13985 [Deinococcus sp. Arct2-2]